MTLHPPRPRTEQHRFDRVAVRVTSRTWVVRAGADRPGWDRRVADWLAAERPGWDRRVAAWIGGDRRGQGSGEASGEGEPSVVRPRAGGDIGLELVHRTQAGDLEAFGELYDRYSSQVLRYVTTRVSSQQLAEDVTSETFLRALLRISTFTWQGRDVVAWLVTIARNLIADHYKSSRTRLELPTDDITVSARIPVEDGPELAVVEAMSNGALLHAVAQLGDEQRRCVELRFLEGLSVTETALVLDRNEAAVRALQYRAVRSLGRMLSEATVS